MCHRRNNVHRENRDAKCGRTNRQGGGRAGGDTVQCEQQQSHLTSLRWDLYYSSSYSPLVAHTAHLTHTTPAQSATRKIIRNPLSRNEKCNSNKVTIQVSIFLFPLCRSSKARAAPRPRNTLPHTLQISHPILQRDAGYMIILERLVLALFSLEESQFPIRTC